MKKQYINGVISMLLSALVFSVMSGLVRYASNIDAYKTTFFRFAIGLALLGTAAILGKIKLDFFNNRMLFSRGLFGGIATFIYYLSISKIGVAKGTIISYSSPIFVAIISMFVLKEKISPVKWLLILLAFIGLFLVSLNKGELTIALGFYELLAIFGAVCAGFALVSVKKLQESDSSYSIFFSQCAIGFWMVVIPANLIPSSIGISGGIVLLLIGITAAVGQLLMTHSYRYLPVTTGSLLSMLTPIFNIFIGVLLFKEGLTKTGVLGILLVLVSCLTMIALKDEKKGVTE
ncbi:MAG: hypothetical protein A2252_02860 [Elusimicrobia bacterium RIFOXYA2_FULL_39_19]|nr:MAG: hypothetical protein A2252_02860 [Elusimicrobia bacterium RIFOXYA2_FULL_39_19]